MNRRIKIAAWIPTIKGGRLENSPFLFSDGMGDFSTLDTIGDGEYSIGYGVIPLLFLGVDKNGKDIYEDFIIQYHQDESEYKGIVGKFSPNGVSIKIISSGFIGSDGQYIAKHIFTENHWHEWGEAYDKIVIGNIHENPDLLK